jgi:glycosyltransferase involved in cell wall biosynthesis
MKTRRILIFNWQDIKHPLGGGAEVHLHEIFRRLVQKGHSVTLYCSMFEGAAKEETVDGIRVVREGNRNLFNFYVPFRYGSRFRYERYDIVVDDINKIPFYTPLYVKEPILALVHHLFRSSIFRETSLPAALYVYSSESLAMSVYRRTPVAVYSESSREELLSHGFSEELIHKVPIAISTKPQRVRIHRTPTVGYVGRIKKYKSVDHLLRAFQIVLREIPAARLVVVGDGDARPGLEQLSRQLGISSSTQFEGFVDEKRKIQLLNHMDVVVNTSAKEGWGLTVTEANACGVPVVASNVPGLRDSVIDGKTGLLYEYGNISQLSRKILDVLNDRKLRARLSKGALQWAKSFSWDKSAEKMEKVIETIIEEAKTRATARPPQ